ncbi:MAG: hypothetical protein ACT4OS_11430 [Acidimicrobiales bacterium]
MKKDQPTGPGGPEALTPATLASHSFTHVFRGFNIEEVRVLLAAASAAWAESQARAEALAQEVAAMASVPPGTGPGTNSGTNSGTTGADSAAVNSAEPGQPGMDRADAGRPLLSEAAGGVVDTLADKARGAAADDRPDNEPRRRAAEVLAGVRDQAAAEMEAARERAGQILGEAEAVVHARAAEASTRAVQLIAEARQQAKNILDEANLEAQAIVSSAIIEGRDLVGEARSLRQRTLSDLHRRRQVAELQIDQLRAGRARLAQAVEAVRQSLETMTRELSMAEPDARRAAEAIGRRATNRPGPDPAPRPSHRNSGRAEHDPRLGSSRPGSARPHTAPGSTARTESDAPVAESARWLPRPARRESSIVMAGPGHAAPPPEPASSRREDDAESGRAMSRPVLKGQRAGSPPRVRPQSVTEASLVGAGAVPDIGLVPATADPLDGHADAKATEPNRVAESLDVIVAEPKPIDQPPVATATEPESIDDSSGTAAAADSPETEISDPMNERSSARDDVEAPHLDEAAPQDRGVEADPVDSGPGQVTVTGRATHAVDDLFARIRADQRRQAGRRRPGRSSQSGPPVEQPTALPSEPPQGEPARGITTPGEPASGQASPQGSRPTTDREVASGPMGGAIGGDAAVGAAATETDGADEQALANRDRLLDPLEAQLNRSLKRVLQDEQSELLDRIRRSRGHLDGVLATPAEQVERYTLAALGALTAAAAAGAAFAGRPGAELDVAPLAEELAHSLADALRGRVATILTAEADAGSGADRRATASAPASGGRGESRRSVAGSGRERLGPAERVSAVYRQWKLQHIPGLVRHHLALAFNAGAFEATASDQPMRWVVDDDDRRCPDCDDNALAGPLTRGTPYPTGQCHPPAHNGCRCLLVPMESP